MESFIANPKNYKKPLVLDAETNRLVIIDTNQDVDALLAANQQVDIPFLYNTTSVFIEKLDESEKLLAQEELTFDFSRSVEPQIRQYFENQKRHIDGGHFSLVQLRAYLLVKSYILHHLNTSHSFMTVGSSYAFTPSEESQKSIQSFHQELYESNNGELFHQVQKQFDRGLRAEQVKKIQEKVSVDFNDMYLKNSTERNKEDESRYCYFRTESARILNLSIDEMIANKRNALNKLPVKFFYRSKTEKGLKAFESQVFSTVNEINMKNFQQQTKLSDKVMSDAAFVANVLIQDHDTYLKSQNYLGNMGKELFEQNFAHPLYLKYRQPVQGDENILSIRYFQIARLFVEKKLGVAEQTA